MREKNGVFGLRNEHRSHRCHTMIMYYYLWTSQSQNCSTTVVVVAHVEGIVSWNARLLSAASIVAQKQVASEEGN